MIYAKTLTIRVIGFLLLFLRQIIPARIEYSDKVNHYSDFIIYVLGKSENYCIHLYFCRLKR